MRIAKIIDKKGRELFAEVVKIGRVLFDARPGWVLVSSPLDMRPRKRATEFALAVRRVAAQLEI